MKNLDCSLLNVEKGSHRYGSAVTWNTSHHRFQPNTSLR